MTAILIKSFDRCGKDTTATELCRIIHQYGFTCNIIPLAEPLKKTVAKILNLDLSLLEKMKNDNIPICLGTEITDTRKAIIRVAESLKEVFGRDLFVNTAIEKSKELNPDFVIIPDARYVIEFDTVRHSSVFDRSYVIEVNSNLKTCGKNGIRYDLDKIEPDYSVRNLEGSVGVLKQDLENIFGEILKELGSD